jgi:hypothetical protein
MPIIKSTKETNSPSFAEVLPAFIQVVATDLDVSFITVEAVTPPAVTVKVSEPSVSKSFRTLTEIVATPLELITALPLNSPPDMSAELIPESV